MHENLSYDAQVTDERRTEEATVMQRQYKNPPVREVVCAFSFQSDSPWDLTIPGLLYDRIRSDFPDRLPPELHGEEVDVDAERLVQDRSRFASSDKTTLVQVGRDFLSVHHQLAYRNWDYFAPLVQRVMEAYQEVARPQAVRHVALSYANRLDLPKADFELSKYLNFYPYLGKGLPQGAESFFVGVVFPFEEGRDSLEVTMTDITVDRADVRSIALNLTYYKSHSDGTLLEESFQSLELAHARVRETFEASLTDATRELFN